MPRDTYHLPVLRVDVRAWRSPDGKGGADDCRRSRTTPPTSAGCAPRGLRARRWTHWAWRPRLLHPEDRRTEQVTLGRGHRPCRLQASRARPSEARPGGHRLLPLGPAADRGDITSPTSWPRASSARRTSTPTRRLCMAAPPVGRPSPGVRRRHRAAVRPGLTTWSLPIWWCWSAPMPPGCHPVLYPAHPRWRGPSAACASSPSIPGAPGHPARAPSCTSRSGPAPRYAAGGTASFWLARRPLRRRKIDRRFID